MTKDELVALAVRLEEFGKDMLDDCNAALPTGDAWTSVVEANGIMRQAAAALRALAAPPSPAQPVKAESWEIQRMCDGCKTATHCAHHKRCLAECVPADLSATGQASVWLGLALCALALVGTAVIGWAGWNDLNPSIYVVCRVFLGVVSLCLGGLLTYRASLSSDDGYLGANRIKLLSGAFLICLGVFALLFSGGWRQED